MASVEGSCCVCLNNFISLNKLSQKDENDIPLISKLTSSVPEISWVIMYQICEPCTNLLGIVHHFRETCIKSEVIRKKQAKKCIKKEQVHKDNEDNTNEKYKIEEVHKNKKDNTIKKCENDLMDDNNIKDEDDNDPSYSDEDIDDDKDLDFETVKEEKKSTKRKRNFEFLCEVCTKKYSSSKELVAHCFSEHNMTPKEVRPFVCTRCTSRFANSSNLLQHMKYHEAVRCNVCSYCGKGFITKTDLKIHEKQHLNKREYRCDICLKGFNTHKDLRSHKLVVHTNPDLWKYLCEYCNKKFPIKSNYDCHLRRHTGEKNFECHLCYKKFTDKCVLQRHMRTHSNVREFRCSECQREYKEKRVMQIHMAKVHGIGVGEIKLPVKERRYICHMCPKAYFAKNKLTRHLYTHTGEKPFFCTVCNKKFNDKSYVKQHMKKAHNIKSDSPL